MECLIKWLICVLSELRLKFKNGKESEFIIQSDNRLGWLISRIANISYLSGIRIVSEYELLQFSKIF